MPKLSGVAAVPAALHARVRSLVTLKKILAISLCCAGLYAAVLGSMALAQDPSPTATSSAESTQTPEASATATATGTAESQSPTPTASAQTPTPTASSSPTQTASPTVTSTPFSTPFSTPAQPTPYPSPVETVVGDPTATPGSLGLDLSPKGRKHGKRRNGHAGTGAIVDEGCLTGKQTKKAKKSKKSAQVVGSLQNSTSTTASECDLLNSNAPSDVLGTDTPRATQRPDGTPTPANPGYSLATPGAAPIGVPNFFIDKFRIPPFLLPIYQAAGIAVRHPLGGAGGDQRDRDRLRAQPQRLLRRRAGLDAVHARDLEARTASTPTATA